MSFVAGMYLLFDIRHLGEHISRGCADKYRNLPESLQGTVLGKDGDATLQHFSEPLELGDL